MIKALAFLCCLSPLWAFAATAEDVLAEAKADCASIDNGVFTAGPNAVIKTDVTGDGQPETIVDSRGFICSASPRIWSGIGGDKLWIVVGDMHWALGTGHWALGTGHWALGTGHWALGTGSHDLRRDRLEGSKAHPVGVGQRKRVRRLAISELHRRPCLGRERRSGWQRRFHVYR